MKQLQYMCVLLESICCKEQSWPAEVLIKEQKVTIFVWCTQCNATRLLSGENDPIFGHAQLLSTQHVVLVCLLPNSFMIQPVRRSGYAF